ncbi:uncharacterized protein LOC116294778 [Actinia tenebrosa]|uniref:Uncharacterized protein LOC116294778 n=1 Tax=Actinia tenebrosa TaxID=6105 RepID=A0A6P8I0A9_ACTTE|nr:uncharacterized protein LOC116294778 [Actinia tenebrosa]
MMFQPKRLHWLLTFCFFLVTTTTTKADGCPSPCKCYYFMGSHYVTDCSKKGLKVVPKFENTTEVLFMGHNQLKKLPVGIFDNNRNLVHLTLTDNQITSLPAGIFDNNKKLFIMFLQGNKISSLPQQLFRNNLQLFGLNIGSNLIKELPQNLLRGLTQLTYFFVGRNKLQYIPGRFFKDNTNLGILSFEMNNVSSIDLQGMKKITVLSVYQNGITSRSLSGAVLNKLTLLNTLFASYNRLEDISDYSFLRSSNLHYLMLNNNRLKQITNRTFYGASQLEILFLSDNPIEYIAQRAFFTNSKLKNLHLVQTKIKSVNIDWYHPSIYRIGTVVLIHPTEQPQEAKVPPSIEQLFIIAGFRCRTDNMFSYCAPCLFGTYIIFNISTNNHSCVGCPAGGFYEDSLAYFGERAYGNGCKMCDNGTFVHVKTAPGKRKDDCKSCPQGTQNKYFAGFRACQCQDGFYRLDRFEKCYFCPDSGVMCFNESMTLNPGYYWQWISQSEKENYINFTNELQIFDDSYNRELVTFHGSFPKHYQCPRLESCLGGMDASCAEGYTGPLCAVCDKGQYNLVSTCFKCPKLGWLIFQISAISLVVVAVFFLVIKGKRQHIQSKRSLTDIILARLKIIISFYQIFSSTLDGFSYVKWPRALAQISEYAKFIQLNVLQIAPLHCFSSRFKMDAYDHLVTACSTTAMVILMTLIYYNLKLLYTLKTTERSGKSAIFADLEARKEICYRNVFLFIFVTYPQTCSTIFSMLPAACHKICQDSSQTQCTFYLKADYSITCFTDKYNRYVIFAYAALIYPFAVPILTVVVLWKYYFKNLHKRLGNEVSGEEMSENNNDAPCSKQTSQQTNTTQCTSTTSPHIYSIERQTARQIDVLLEQQERKTDEINEFAIHADLGLDSNLGIEKSMVEKKIGETKGKGSDSTMITIPPIIAGMSFIFENYAENCWFWEIIEMMRKLLLTSSLALIGAEGRTSLGVASILSGCYAILHAYFKPIPDKFEHVLQLTALLVTFANTCIGMMLKIDQDALLNADAKFMDSWIMTVLLVMTNIMVTALVVVKYVMVVGKTVYSIIKNPRCSLACCLSVILTLDEVQSEARSMGSNIGLKMKTQLQSGNEFEGLSMEDAAGDYGLTGIDMDNDEDDDD